MRARPPTIPPRNWDGLFRSKNSRARGFCPYEPGPPYTCARCAVSPEYQARHTSMSANGSANWVGGQGVFPDGGSGITVSFNRGGVRGAGGRRRDHKARVVKRAYRVESMPWSATLMGLSSPFSAALSSQA